MEKKSRYAFFDPAVLEKKIADAPFEKLNTIVCEMLEEAIITRKLPPRSKINMVQIAQNLGISRTPVKEAAEMLLKNGLVVSPPRGGGYYVFDVSGAYMAQFFETRKMIEGYAAYLCSERNFQVDIKKLKHYADEFFVANKEQDHKKFAEADEKFHAIVVDSCGNSFLINIYHDLNKTLKYYWARTEEYLIGTSSQMFSGFDVIANQHRAICNAIQMGIPELAETSMRSHLDSVFTAFYALSPPKDPTD